MKSQRSTLNVKELAPLLAVGIAGFYFIISGIIINGVIQIIAFSSIVFLSLIISRGVHFSTTDLLLALSVIPFFYSINEWNISAIRDLVGYVAFVALVIFAKVETNNVDRAIRLLYSIAVFHLIFIFINFLFRPIYNEIMRSILDYGAKIYFEKAIKGNYYTGFGYIPGDTSGYFVNGIILLLFGDCLIKSKNKAIKVGLFFIGILLCAKKSHLLCLFLSIFITWIVSGRGSEKVKRIMGTVLLVVSLLTFCYIMLPFFTNIPMISRISVSLDNYINGKDFTSNRSHLTNIAMQMYNDNRILGSGWKSFNRYTKEQWGYTNYVNNVYLQIATETGIIGLFLFIMPLIIILIKTYRKLKNTLNNKSNHNVYSIKYIQLSFTLQLFFLLYCFLEIPFYDYTFLLIYGFAIVISNCTNLVFEEQKP